MAGTPDIPVADEQLLLMAAYLQLRREAENPAKGRDRLIREGRAAERLHQAAEKEAWAALRER